MKSCVFLLLGLSILASPMVAQADECIGAGGFVLGDGINPLPPAGSSGVYYDNTLLTASLDPPALNWGAPAFNDGWFAYTATASGGFLFSTCFPGGFAAGTNTDTQLAVYGGTCGALVEINSDDDSCATTPFLNTDVVAGLTFGSTYFVRVSSWGGPPVGTFYLTVTPPPPPVAPEDDCSGALVVLDGVNPSPPLGIDGTFYTSAGFTNSGAPSSCGLSPSADIWFSYVPPITGVMSASTCTPPGFFMLGSMTDTVVNIYDGTGGCGLLVEIGCDDDSCGFLSTASAPVTAGTPYFVRVSDWGGGPGGSFYLTVGTVFAAPNDECLGAIAVSDGINPLPPFGVDGTTYDNTPASLSAVPMPNCWGGFASNDVWFSYIASATGYMTARTCQPAGFTIAGTNLDTQIEILSLLPGGCASPTSLGANDQSCGGLSSQSAAVSAGSVYLVRVASWGGGPHGTFYLEILPPGPGPTNDECATPTVLSAGANGPFDNTMASDSAGVAASCAFGDPGGKDLWFSYTSNCTALTIDTCSPAGTNFDTILSVYTTCGGAEVACDDQGCGTGLSSVSFASTPGTTYLVRVASWGACYNWGTFSINVSDGGPFTMTPSNPAPPAGFWSVQIDWTGGPPLGTVAFIATPTAGAYPAGWFFGIDPTVAEVSVFLGDPAFNALPLDICGAFQLGPFFVPVGFPLGLIPFYSVSLGIPAASTTPSIVSNTAIVTIQ